MRPRPAGAIAITGQATGCPGCVPAMPRDRPGETIATTARGVPLRRREGRGTIDVPLIDGCDAAPAGAARAVLVRAA